MTNETSENSKRIEFSPIFIQKLEKAPAEVKIAFRQALEVFFEEPNHIALRNHMLTEKYAGIHSIDVTDDWRALYREEPERIIFVELGIHKDLYT